MKILIRNGRVIDPASGRDELADVAIASGRIVGIGRVGDFAPERELDAAGLVVAPGLVDLAARLREPGREHQGMLESELQAAAAGGVTSLVCPPDTEPPLDEPGLVEMLKFRARKLSRCRLFPLGALTRALQGEALTEMAELTEAGCIGFSQADVPVRDTLVLLRERAPDMPLLAIVTPKTAGVSRKERDDLKAFGQERGLRSGTENVAAIVNGRLTGLPNFVDEYLGLPVDDGGNAVEDGTREAPFRVVIPRGEGDYRMLMFGHGTGGSVEVSNKTSVSGKAVIADAIRFGNGMGDVVRSGVTSGLPREDESTLYWIEAMAGWLSPGVREASSNWRTSAVDDTANVATSFPGFADLARHAGLRLVEQPASGMGSPASR